MFFFVQLALAGIGLLILFSGKLPLGSRVVRNPVASLAAALLIAPTVVSCVFWFFMGAAEHFAWPGRVSAAIKGEKQATPEVNWREQYAWVDPALCVLGLTLAAGLVYVSIQIKSEEDRIIQRAEAEARPDTRTPASALTIRERIQQETKASSTSSGFAVGPLSSPPAVFTATRSEQLLTGPPPPEEPLVQPAFMREAARLAAEASEFDMPTPTPEPAITETPLPPLPKRMSTERLAQPSFMSMFDVPTPPPAPATTPQMQPPPRPAAASPRPTSAPTEPAPRTDDFWWLYLVFAPLIWVVAAILNQMLANMEANGGEIRIPWISALTYQIGGRWGVVALLSGVGLLSLILGLSQLAKQRDHAAKV